NDLRHAGGSVTTGYRGAADAAETPPPAADAGSRRPLARPLLPVGGGPPDRARRHDATVENGDDHHHRRTAVQVQAVGRAPGASGRTATGSGFFGSSTRSTSSPVSSPKVGKSPVTSTTSRSVGGIEPGGRCSAWASAGGDGWAAAGALADVVRRAGGLRPGVPAGEDVGSSWSGSDWTAGRLGAGALAGFGWAGLRPDSRQASSEASLFRAVRSPEARS